MGLAPACFTRAILAWGGSSVEHLGVAAVYNKESGKLQLCTTRCCGRLQHCKQIGSSTPDRAHALAPPAARLLPVGHHAVERTSVQQDTCKVSRWFEHPSRPKCEELPSLELCTVLKASSEPSNTSKQGYIASHRSPCLRSSCVREHVCWLPHTERHRNRTLHASRGRCQAC